MPVTTSNKNNKKNYKASNSDVALVVAEPTIKLFPWPILYHHRLGDISNINTTLFEHMYGETTDRTEKNLCRDFFPYSFPNWFIQENMI